MVGNRFYIPYYLRMTTDILKMKKTMAKEF